MVKVNKAKCLKCNDIIESRHQHDFVQCKCRNIFVDGGREYLRRGAVEMDKFEELSCRPDCFLGDEDDCPGIPTDGICQVCEWQGVSNEK